MIGEGPDGNNAAVPPIPAAAVLYEETGWKRR